MRSFSELKKNIKRYKETKGLREVCMALLGDTATQFLHVALQGYGYEAGYRTDIYESEYDVLETEILDPSSGLYDGKRDYVVIYMSSEKAYDAYTRLDNSEREVFADKYVSRIEGYWNTISGRMGAKIIQFDFNRIETGVGGNLGNKEKASWEYQYRKLQYLIREAAARTEGVYVLSLDDIQTRLGRDTFCDMRFYYDARMSVSTDALPEVAKAVFDIVDPLGGKVKKCLILDLDNTIWGGVIGDDGINGIELGELGKGRIYADIQRWCLELKKRGIILAVCSKNNADTAKEPFEKHPDMLLRLEDIAVFVANWNDKAQNIRYIRDVLNIGMDSMVFLDDSPFERSLVKEMLPEVTVPELPEEPAEWITYLSALDLFESPVSAVGGDRTKKYKEEAERRSAKQHFDDVNEYLKSLQMKAVCNAFDEFHYPRIAELSQRSNQFNLRTVRYTEDQIRAFAESDKYITLYFTLNDRFGDYGLVSAVIMEKISDKEAFIDTWFMSCRVLNRGMEEFIVNSLVETAKEQGIEKITGEYIPTNKNKMVENIYSGFGFETQGDGIFTLNTKNYTQAETFIEKASPAAIH
ncbi:MAG: HAD-IIIC family phosphatase [Lachnospiraceae bacterium]|nr:HAD-IIIC family phosphatase [Lachnospiraceae bacterium]